MTQAEADTLYTRWVELCTNTDNVWEDLQALTLEVITAEAACIRSFLVERARDVLRHTVEGDLYYAQRLHQVRVPDEGRLFAFTINETAEQFTRRAPGLLEENLPPIPPFEQRAATVAAVPLCIQHMHAAYTDFLHAVDEENAVSIRATFPACIEIIQRYGLASADDNVEDELFFIDSVMYRTLSDYLAFCPSPSDSIDEDMTVEAYVRYRNENREDHNDDDNDEPAEDEEDVEEALAPALAGVESYVVRGLDLVHFFRVLVSALNTGGVADLLSVVDSLSTSLLQTADAGARIIRQVRADETDFVYFYQALFERLPAQYCLNPVLRHSVQGGDTLEAYVERRNNAFRDEALFGSRITRPGNTVAFDPSPVTGVLSMDPQPVSVVSLIHGEFIRLDISDSDTNVEQSLGIVFVQHPSTNKFIPEDKLTALMLESRFRNALRNGMNSSQIVELYKTHGPIKWTDLPKLISNPAVRAVFDADGFSITHAFLLTRDPLPVHSNTLFDEPGKLGPPVQVPANTNMTAHYHETREGTW